MSCDGGFTPGGAYDSVWDSVKPMTGNFFFYYFQYQDFVGCVCMLNYWFSSNDDICPDNYNYSRFKLKDKCRSEKWEVYLYGDMTIMVEHAQVHFFDSVTRPLLLRQGMRSRRAETAEVSAVAVHGVTGRLSGPCTQVHGHVFPLPSGRRRGGGDAGSLLPGVLPPN